jgi:type VI secretion system secreted protein VgrG
VPSVASLVARPAGDPGSSPVADGYDSLIEASATRASYNVNGQGMAAAVIDEGVNYNNAALGGGFGSGFKVSDGADLADNTSDPLATTTQHGTGVAGIIASNSTTYPGVAPGANIVALKVFDNSGNGNYETIANALQWVVDHHAQDNITVVNLSISDGNNYAIDFFSQDDSIGQTIAGLVQKLNALNIPVVTATGNSFNGQPGMGFIAIESGTISVTSTDSNDQFASNAQRLGSSAFDPGTSFTAPGVNVVAPSDGNNFSTDSGTSFSTAEVTGSIILLQQIYEQRFGALPKVSDVVGWLKAGAKPITDSVTGATIGRIDVLKAAAQIPGPPTTTTTTNTPPGNTTTPPANSNTPPANNSTGGSQTTGTQQSNMSGGTQTTQPGSTSTPASPPPVNLFINGQSAGQVDSTSASNPFVNYASLFGVNVTFQRVQIWNSSASSVGSGGAAPSGEIGATMPTASKSSSLSNAVGTGPTVRIATRQQSVFENHMLSEVGHVIHGKPHMAGRKVAVSHRRG